MSAPPIEAVEPEETQSGDKQEARWARSGMSSPAGLCASQNDAKRHTESHQPTQPLPTSAHATALGPAGTASDILREATHCFQRNCA
ncbi:hypothetical protein GGTG_10826 [Gaeumannomyces tritici R3-111a-1]|uniref:Uncharacterized protein n=1 Tax=Gaeumannomyces tritici (strain R3-111a-1) TaxID=644352 RepID=J3PBF3_GAET3|nr:hypothetical protein GGTG_10826 [Gaeumannomyces tritici R3-111a-1]EJT71570.1 hypothetical protein GGTG_10826 [Gaeumannomyces tritici R3-111a-1]